MYAASRLAAKYIRYYLTAANGRGHGIHSPFVFDFIVHVLNDTTPYPSYDIVEARRSHMLKDKTLLEIEDFGAGSVKGNSRQRTVQSIAKSALKSPRFGQVFFRMAHYYRPQTMIELGTSLGISSLYLSMGNPKGKLVTCEGASAVAGVAKKNFTALQVANVEVVTGNFDDTLPDVLAKTASVDLAFIDGNHRAEPTIRYFEQLLEKINYPGIVIFDDIHWSAEMEAAWQQIKEHPAVMLTVDLFFTGIVFFNNDFKVKQHFVIRF